MKVVLPLLALLLATGCSGQPANVSGLVTLDGQPLDRGAVSFHSVDGGPTAVGSIDTLGRYELKTGEQDGLPPGEYLITVVATGDPISPNNFDSPTPGELLTPTKYGSPRTTDLRETVVTGGNEINLPLQNP